MFWFYFQHKIKLVFVCPFPLYIAIASKIYHCFVKFLYLLNYSLSYSRIKLRSHICVRLAVCAQSRYYTERYLSAWNGSVATSASVVLFVLLTTLTVLVLRISNYEWYWFVEVRSVSVNPFS